MRVRRLKWKKYDDGKTLSAETPFGRYWIEQRYKGEFTWHFRDHSDQSPDEFKCVSFADGKRMCFADWLKQIKPIFIGPLP